MKGSDKSYDVNNTGKRAGMKVLIVESSYPNDFYKQKLDGIAAQVFLRFSASATNFASCSTANTSGRP